MRMKCQAGLMMASRKGKESLEFMRFLVTLQVCLFLCIIVRRTGAELIDPLSNFYNTTSARCRN